MNDEKTKTPIHEEKLKNVVGGISSEWMCMECGGSVPWREISDKKKCPLCGAWREISGHPAPVEPIRTTPVPVNPANPVGSADPANPALPPPTEL